MKTRTASLVSERVFLRASAVFLPFLCMCRERESQLPDLHLGLCISPSILCVCVRVRPGTLLGNVQNGVIEITNCFPVPHVEKADEDVRQAHKHHAGRKGPLSLTLVSFFVCVASTNRLFQ